MATVTGLVTAVLFGWTLGPAAPSPHVELAVDNGGPKTLTIKTDRAGPHHIIRAALLGPNGHTQVVSFIVDTGATDMVLPESMADRLGFTPDNLRTVELQTANGVATAREGVLKSIQLGGPDNNDVIERVAVVFLGDDETGGVALMGMNVLGRYKVTIEDDADQIILVKRH